jgi:hypothetical protein
LHFFHKIIAIFAILGLKFDKQRLIEASESQLRPVEASGSQLRPVEVCGGQHTWDLT